MYIYIYHTARYSQNYTSNIGYKPNGVELLTWASVEAKLLFK